MMRLDLKYKSEMEESGHQPTPHTATYAKALDVTHFRIYMYDFTE